jgi:eukaryotic-like serine/threonine-protein kinase
MSHEMPRESLEPNGETLALEDPTQSSGDPVFEALLDEHRRRWLDGEPIGAADYLALNPIFQADPSKAATLIYQEFVLREQRGDPVSFAEYVADFSPYATDLRLLHDADRFVTQLLADSPARATAGRFLGEYELLEEIGRGGMGIVYRARQVGLTRLVALKTLSAGEHASAVDIERFCNEARAVGQLQHPNIVAVHTAGVDDGRHFFTMDLIEGKSLAELVRQGPLSPPRAAGYVRAVAEAIHYAHEKGILHRDLKPSNIIIDGSDQPRITDFGLAHWLAANSKLTLTGQVLGTPGYMPPEQASGNRGQLSAASDVYALGAILYELVTGRPTVLADTPLEALLQVAQIEPVSPRLLNPRVPRDLETICLKCLEKEPLRRYASAGELAADLGRFLEGLAVRARPIGKMGRLARWCRRNPVAAGLAAGVVCSLLAGICVSTYFAITANRRADDAVRARLDSEYRLYVADMRLAHRAWDDNQVPRLLELLDAHRPRATGGMDLRGFEWSYLDRLCHSALFTLKGLGDTTRGVSYSRDGKLLAAAGSAGVRIWDSATGRLLHNLPGRGGRADCVAFSPDGQRLATGCESSIVIWNAVKGEPLLTLKGSAGLVRSVAFSPDGKTLVGAGMAGKAILWDTATGREARRLLLGGAAVVAVAYSPDGTRVAVGADDDTVTVWTLASGTPPLVLRRFQSNARALAFSPDGGRLAYGSHQNILRICDAASGRELLALKGHTDHVDALAYSPDGQRLASVSNDLSVRVWDAGTGRPMHVFRGHARPVQCVAFSPDGTRVASGSDDDTVRVWDATRSQEALTLKGHSAEVNNVAFSADGHRLATASDDGTVGVWDISVTGKIKTLEGHGGAVYALAFCPRGKGLATGADDGTVRIWDESEGRCKLTLKGHTGRVWTAAFSPGGDRLATGGHDGTVRIWDTASGRALFTCEGHRAVVSGVAFRPDGKELASAGWDFDLRIWNTDDGRQLRTLRSNDAPNWRVAYSPDGERLVAVSNDRTARIWDVARGQLVHTLKGHTAEVSGVAFSPDGARVATAGWDGTVRVWDAASGQEMLTLRCRTTGVFAVAFSPDSHRLASTTADGAVQIWDATPPCP